MTERSGAGPVQATSLGVRAGGSGHVRAPDGPAIDVVGLTRTYSMRSGWPRRKVSRVDAVRSIDFAVSRGETFGLLGPNGAGKTTTIKMLNTLLLPTSGSARVLGFDVVNDFVEIRKRIGYVAGGDRGLYDRISALDNLRYFAELYGVDPRVQRKRIPLLLDQFGLTGRERDRVEGYSRGMKQRLHIARGLLNDPEVLFLDEPSLGLDPVAARGLREMIADLSGRGMTIILTTHYMAEADELCDRLAIIDRGVIQAQGTPAELKRATTDATVVDIVAIGVTADHLDRLRQLDGRPDVTHVEDAAGSTISIHSASPAADVIVAAVRELADIRIVRLTPREPTLEDVYVSIVDEAVTSPRTTP